MADNNDVILQAVDKFEEAFDELSAAVEKLTDQQLKAKLASYLPKIQTLLDGINTNFSD